MTHRALTFLVAVGFAGGLHGCHPYDCEEHATCHITCDPAAGSMDEIIRGCAGVFVSNSSGSDENSGAHDAPVSTLGKALSLAQPMSGNIYVCAEVFTESLTIPSGVSLWGGVDCAAGWAYVGGNKKTTIAPEAGSIPLRFAAGTEKATVADVHAEAANASEAGASSIAALVNAGSVVEILRSELVAGNGAIGAPGGAGGVVPAKNGAAGAPGSAACSSSTVPGGAATINTCRGGISVGGQGGHGSPTAGSPGTNGGPEPVPNQAGSGLGGDGGTSAAACTYGAPGVAGTAGEHGKGAAGPGRITEDGWEGEPGQDGVDGRPGQGGGGGGGSLAGAMFCGAGPQGGASGGSGGAGGCGGSGGKGGGYGGGSIGLLTLSGNVTIRATSIKTGRGGVGGNGGLGQAGGLGGPGGEPGAGVALSPWGCYGGFGGDGGLGGHGGGGLGGPSIGVLHAAGQQPTLAGVFIRTDAAGKGGLGGNPSVPGSAGGDGASHDVAGFPP